MYDVRKCNGPKNCFGTDTVWKSSLDCKSDNVFENAVRINGSVCVSVICVLYTCHCVRCTYLLLSHRYRCTAHNSNRRHYSLHRTSNYKKKHTHKIFSSRQYALLTFSDHLSTMQPAKKHDSFSGRINSPNILFLFLVLFRLKFFLWLRFSRCS